jgi:hypothetical protein
MTGMVVWKYIVIDTGFFRFRQLPGFGGVDGVSGSV